jgi:Tfp pilus assembly protein PilF
MRLLPSLSLVLVVAAVPALGQDAVARSQRAEAQRHYELGTELMRSESFERAADEFKQAIKLDPQMLLAHYSLGQSYMSLKRYPEATAAYVAGRDVWEQQSHLDDKQRAAIDRERRDHINELKEALRTVRAQSGRTGAGGGEPIGAVQIEARINLLESADSRESRSGQAPAELSLALGSSYFRQGLLPDAAREYKAAINANSKLGAAHNNLAAVLMMQSQFDEARAAVKAAEKAGYPVSPALKDDIKKREEAAKALKP